MREINLKNTGEGLKAKVPAAKPSFSENDVSHIIEGIKDSLNSGWLTNGPKVQEFEKELARYMGVKNVIATNSGTAALACVLKALNVGGSVILVPDNTFAATAHAVLWNKGAVSLVDIEDPRTFNVGPSSLNSQFQKLDERNSVKGVIVVHIAGHPVDMEPINEFCKEHDLFLIEDAAHAHGSEYKDRRCGAFSNAACLSFFPTKLVTTGEGGAILTNDSELAEKCRSIANQGRGTLYTSDVIMDGFNFRMSDINACIGLIQLKHLDEWIKHRRKIAHLYNDLLSASDWIEPPIERKYAKTNYYKYVCLVNKEFKLSSDEIKKELDKKGISCGMGVFWPPLHRTSFYGKGLSATGYPVAEDSLPRQLCLPMYSTIKEDEVHYVVDSLKGVK